MTRKIYRSSNGKVVDMGALLLQNESVRAVGNMNINARGDILDSKNKVVEPKTRQVQRQYKKQTNMTTESVTTSTKAARKQAVKAEKQERKQTKVMVTNLPKNSKPKPTAPVLPNPTDDFSDMPQDDPEDLAVVKEPVQTEPAPTERTPRGGLAAAIARSKTVKQELEKTQRQKQLEQGLRKI